MSEKIRILILEDRPIDAELMLRELRRVGYEPEWKRVETEPDYLAQLDQGWEIILADYNLPQFTGLLALELLKERELDIPFIIVSATIGEDKAVAAMKAGAHDYVMKDNLARLAPAVERELRDAAIRRDRRRLEQAERNAGLQWQATFAAVRDGICLLDPDRKIMRANRTMAEMFGRSADDIMGSSCCEIVHDARTPAPACPVLHAMTTRSRQSIDLSFSDRLYEITADPILDERGVVTGAVQVVRDITVRKWAEEKITSQLEELQRWQDVMLDREDRAQEFKREINQLCHRLSETTRYASQEAGSADSENVGPKP
jgi:PAS domain S-box-containing protein